MTPKAKPIPEQPHQLDAPVTLTPDQIAEAVGGVAGSLAKIDPTTTVGMINPDLFEQ